MRFGEAVRPEPLDLREDRIGIFPGEAVFQHSVDEPEAELLDQPGPSPGTHRAAELVGLARREAGHGDRQPHRLFLEEGHAERLFEDFANLVVRIGRFLLPVAAAEVRMDHLPLNRPRPDDRHLDDQVVEALRLQPRQHGHLGPAFNLKNAHRIGVLNHLVDGRVLRRDGRRGQADSVVLFDQIETAADGGEHPECQTVDLEDSQFVQVVLVPLDDRPIRHGGVFDWDRLAKQIIRHHHSAGML